MMPALVAGIRVFLLRVCSKKDVDGRHKAGDEHKATFIAGT